MSLGDISDTAGQHLAGETARRKKLIDANDPTLDFFTGSGDPTQSPLYGAFLGKNREAISSSYDNAVANTRANARARGFGYGSPNVEGAEEGVRAQEAGALSEAPRQAIKDVINPMEFAVGARAQEASMFDPAKWAGLELQTQNARDAKHMALFNGIMKLAGTILGGPISGLADSAFGGGGGDFNPSDDGAP